MWFWDRHGNPNQTANLEGCLDKRVKIKANQEDTISFAEIIKFALALELSAQALSGPSFKQEPGAAKIESAYRLGDSYRGSKKIKR